MPNGFHHDALLLVIDVLFILPKDLINRLVFNGIILKTCPKKWIHHYLHALAPKKCGQWIVPQIWVIPVGILHFVNQPLGFSLGRLVAQHKTKKKICHKNKQKEKFVVYSVLGDVMLLWWSLWSSRFFFQLDPVLSCCPTWTQRLLPTSIPREGHDGGVVGDDVWANAIALHVAQHAHGFAPESSKRNEIRRWGHFFFETSMVLLEKKKSTTKTFQTQEVL